MSPELRAVVADDEQPAREELCFLLGQIEGVKVVGQADNGVSALAAHRPAPSRTWRFSTSRCPGSPGSRWPACCSSRPVAAPGVVFVTAYDQYAIDAFEVNAVDYLLKPVEQRRLDQAVERVRQRLSAGQARDERIDDLVRLMADRQRQTRSARDQGRRPLPAGPGR